MPQPINERADPPSDRRESLTVDLAGQIINAGRLYEADTNANEQHDVPAVVATLS